MRRHARRARCRDAGRRLRRRPRPGRLPVEAGAPGGRLRGRRHLRRARARARGQARAESRAAGDRRQQARRRHHDRRRVRGEERAGRLHDLAARHHDPRDQREPLREAALRLAEGLHADHAGRVDAADAGGPSVDAGVERAGARRAAEGAARILLVRLLGHRDDRPPLVRDAEVGSGRARRAARAVQGQRARHDRDPRRRGDVRVLDHAAGRVERPRRQAPRARGDHAEAHRGGARGADDDRSRPARLRDRAVQRDPRPGRDELRRRAGGSTPSSRRW